MQIDEPQLFFLLVLCLCVVYAVRCIKQQSIRQRKDGFIGLIGDTPMVELKTLSKATGCTILGKAEFLNPGGSLKDRVANQIVQEAEEDSRLAPGGTIYEGTAGSTGIALAQVVASPSNLASSATPSDERP